MKNNKIHNSIFITICLTFLVQKSEQSSTAVQQFSRNPIAFLQKNVICTEAPMPLWQGVNAANGASLNFGLTPTTDQTAYFLHTVRNPTGLQASYLLTRKSIEVPAYTGNDFIFTPQLDGCSLYVRYNPGSQTITVYHHYRRFNNRGAGNARLTQNQNGKYEVEGRNDVFDDVLAWEQYGGDIQDASLGEAANRVVAHGGNQQSVRHLRQIHVTAFLYRQLGEWYFVYQAFHRNTQTGSRPLDGFTNLGAQMRRIQIPAQTQRPPQVVLRPNNSGRRRG